MIKLNTLPYNYNFGIYETGFEMWWHGATPPLGFLSKQGQLISRDHYQPLLKFAEYNNLIIPDDEWLNNKMYGFFSYGDNLSTFRLPDDRGLYYCHFDSSYHSELGKYLDDTLQGHAHNVTKGSSGIGGGGGTGWILSHGASWVNASEPVAYDNYGTPRFSTRTQPRTMTCIRIIKY